MDILKKICLQKKQEINILKELNKKIERKTSVRNFFKDIRKKNHKNFNLITEIKNPHQVKVLLEKILTLNLLLNSMKKQVQDVYLF